MENITSCDQSSQPKSEIFEAVGQIPAPPPPTPGPLPDGIDLGLPFRIGELPDSIATRFDIHDFPPEQRPSVLADTKPQVCLGISNRTLRENNIDLTLPGLDNTWGLRIPYFSYDGCQNGRNPILDSPSPGVAFVRERLARPRNGQKYSQPAGTSPHVYFPLGLSALIHLHRYVIIAEGEKKALSLVEAGYPAIAIGGIDNFQKRGTLLPEFQEFFNCLDLEGVELTVIYFLGDTDTGLNHAFASAAHKMARLFREAGIDAKIRLPRMSVNTVFTVKGIDDIRATTSLEEFHCYMSDLLTKPIELTPEIDREELTALLFEREEEAVRQLIANATPDKKQWLLKRLAGLANHVNPEVAEEISVMAKDTGLVKKLSHFKCERKRQKQKFDAEMAEKSQEARSPVPIYYAPFSKTKYLYLTPHGEFTRVDRVGAINYLVDRGYSRKAPDSGGLSDAEQVILRAESVPFDYVGPIGGRAAGVYQQNGMRVLVTRGPELLTPGAGDWPTLRAFLKTKFNTPMDPETGVAVIQLPYFMGWLKQAIVNLYKEGGRFTHSQAIILCGAPNVGKNLLQDIITGALGGRKADPFSHMQGDSSFNGELVEVEHWAIADQQNSIKNADRQRLKACIKQTAVNASMHINAKFGKPINIEFYRRLSISLNDEPEALRVLPSLSPDFEDKLIILHVLPGLPFGDGLDFSSYQQWWAAIKDELPAFVHYMLNQHEIVEADRDQRYGITSYKNPEILRKIANQSAEVRFLEIIDQCIFQARSTDWVGNAHDLFRELYSPSTAKELEIIGCTGPVKVGHLLGKLLNARPDRFPNPGLVSGIRRYRILHPQSPCPIIDDGGIVSRSFAGGTSIIQPEVE